MLHVFLPLESNVWEMTKEIHTRTTQGIFQQQSTYISDNIGSLKIGYAFLLGTNIKGNNLIQNGLKMVRKGSNWSQMDPIKYVTSCKVSLNISDEGGQNRTVVMQGILHPHSTALVLQMGYWKWEYYHFRNACFLISVLTETDQATSLGTIQKGSISNKTKQGGRQQHQLQLENRFFQRQRGQFFFT